MKTVAVMIIVVVLSLTSDVQSEKACKKCKRRLAALVKEVETCANEKKDLQSKVASLTKEVDKLKNDSKYIDKCKTDLHDCDANAVCKNTPGSYTCTCKAGYSGNGKTCTDIDECASGANNCHSSAVCTNTEGSFKCSCKAPLTGDGIKSCNSPSPECGNYQTLESADRKITYSKPPVTLKCDDGLTPGWYRFEGDAGTMMPTSCPPAMRCNTHAPGWLNGEHPSVADGKVTRDVCFSYLSMCCYAKTTAEVRNCGSFYVYNLKRAPTCNLRYCGSD